MKRRGVRQKRYGLTPIGLKLSILLCWLATAGVIGLLVPIDNVPIDDPWHVAVLWAGFLVVPTGLYIFDARLSRHQQERDLVMALEAIRKPLRNVSLRGEPPLDFDPHFVSVAPSGIVVKAIDPRRRVIRLIVSNMVDADGGDFEETGKIEEIITGVSHTLQPARFKWYGWVASRAEISVSSRTDENAEHTAKFIFKPDDKAAEGWRKTFDQWMREDSERLGATPRSSPGR